MTKIDFSEWLQSLLTDKGIKPVELARMAHVDPGVISRVLSAERAPTPKTLKAISNALHLPVETVFEKAGIFPPKSTDPIIAEITHLASQLPPEDVQDLIDLARSKIQRHERTANASRKP